MIAPKPTYKHSTDINDGTSAMPENTTQRDPAAHILGAMSQGLDGYIVGMEADGQHQVIQSSMLPTDGPWDDLIALGFTRGEPVEGDPLFTNCTLPEGWSKTGTGHNLWSNVLDERGIERVAVFYKAAFYDRRARMSLTNPGYSASMDAFYGDDAPALPEKWDLFTEQERENFWEGVAQMELDIAEHPDIYGKYRDRLAAIRALGSVAGEQRG